MPKVVYSGYPNFDNNVNFRDNLKPFSDALTTCGILKTTDAGQIDFDNLPTWGANKLMGYEIRRFSDAMQSTLPIVFRIEYWTALDSWSSFNCMRLQIVFGNSSDGNGTIDYPAQRIDLGRQYYRDITGTNVISGDGSYLTFCLYGLNSWSNQAPSIFVVCIGRTVDNDGQPTTEGYNHYGYSSMGTAWHSFIPSPGFGAPRNVQPFMCSAPGNNTASSPDGVGVFPIFSFRGYAGNPDMNAVLYYEEDFGGNNSQVGSVFELPWYSNQTHRYITCGSAFTRPTINGNSGKQWALAIRYED